MADQEIKGQNARIFVSIARKYGLPNYSSVDIQVSLSGDVNPGEKADAAYQRISGKTLEWFDQLAKKVNTGEK